MTWSRRVSRAAMVRAAGGRDVVAAGPLRSAYRATTGTTDPNGVSTFRTRETRLG